jgi:hypothetical protein
VCPIIHLACYVISDPSTFGCTESIWLHTCANQYSSMLVLPSQVLDGRGLVFSGRARCARQQGKLENGGLGGNLVEDEHLPSLPYACIMIGDGRRIAPGLAKDGHKDVLPPF